MPVNFLSRGDVRFLNVDQNRPHLGRQELSILDERDGIPCDSFGVKLRRYRHDRNLSQEELAYASGLSVRAIRNAELGRVRCPRRSSVRRIAEALHLSHDAHEELAIAARAERVIAPDTDTAPAPVEVSQDSHFLVVLQPEDVQPPCLVEIDVMADDRRPVSKIYLSLRVNRSGRG